MNPYKKMYVICEEEYRRMKDAGESKCYKQDESSAPVYIKPDIMEAAQNTINSDIMEAAQSTKKKYTCITCSKQYSDKRGLRRHKKNAHNTQIKISPDKPVKQVQIHQDTPSISKPEKVIRKKKKNTPSREPLRCTVNKWMTLG
jgi:hypothetical protein